MAPNQSEQAEVSKGSRKAFIAGMLLLSVGTVLLSLTGFILTESGFTTSMWFVILALFMMTAGIVVWFKYGHGGTAAERQATSYTLKGLFMAVAFFVLAILIIIVVVVQVPMEQRGLPFFLSISLMVGGVIAAMGFTVKGRMVAERVPPAVIDSFREIEADKTFETRKFTVFRKGDIHVLVPSKFNGAYFVRLFRQAPAPAEKKARVPRLFTRFAFKDEVLGLYLAKRRGEFTIPVDAVKRGDRIEEKYARGSGILYYVSRYDMKHYYGRGIPPDLSGKFDKATISKIMDELSKESRH